MNQQIDRIIKSLVEIADALAEIKQGSEVKRSDPTQDSETRAPEQSPFDDPVPAMTLAEFSDTVSAHIRADPTGQALGKAKALLGKYAPDGGGASAVPATSYAAFLEELKA